MMRTIVLLGTLFTVLASQASELNRITPLSREQVVEYIRSELPPTPALESRTEQLSLFASLDSNRDDQITFREMRRHPGLLSAFNRLDLNNDGVLSRQEVRPLENQVKRIKGLLTLSIARVI